MTLCGEEHLQRNIAVTGRRSNERRWTDAIPWLFWQRLAWRFCLPVFHRKIWRCCCASSRRIQVLGAIVT